MVDVVLNRHMECRCSGKHDSACLDGAENGRESINTHPSFFLIPWHSKCPCILFWTVETRRLSCVSQASQAWNIWSCIARCHHRFRFSIPRLFRSKRWHQWNQFLWNRRHCAFQAHKHTYVAQLCSFSFLPSSLPTRKKKMRRKPAKGMQCKKTSALHVMFNPNGYWRQRKQAQEQW